MEILSNVSDRVMVVDIVIPEQAGLRPTVIDKDYPIK